jgi:14-3-3 protein epsilon
LFHFAHPLDMEAVLNGGPWTFDNNLLILEQIPLGVQIDQIPLSHATLWVQVHDLPTGLMKETVGQRLANYIGTFVEYDKNNNSSFWRQYMRIRVKIDVTQPLKKEAKVKNKEGRLCVVTFKYEKLGIFCFLCGIMGHAENRCEVRYSMEQDDGRRGWSADIRADPRRQGGRINSRWLREERGGPEAENGGAREVRSTNQIGSQRSGPVRADVAVADQRDFPHFPTCQPAGGGQIINTFKEAGPSHQNLQVNSSLIIHPTVTTSSTNHIGPHNQQHTLFTLNSGPIMQPITSPQPFKSATTTNNSLTHLYSPSIHNNDLSIVLSQPITDHNNDQSLPNQSIIFTSHSNTTAPLKSKSTTHKVTRGQNKTNPANRTTKINRPEPANIQPRPDKKTKPANPTHDPHQNPIPPSLKLQESQIMEIQGEKKRRREDEASTIDQSSASDDSFLTAGPGSQDCRDQ